MDKLKDVYLKIKEHNSQIILGGSYSMRLQGIKTPREPKDLDLTLPFGVEFDSAIPGLSHRHASNDDQYINEEFHRSSYTLDGIDVDVFVPQHDGFKQRVEPCMINWSDGPFGDSIDVVHWSECLRQKMIYAISDHETAVKHIADITGIIELNKHPAKSL